MNSVSGIASRLGGWRPADHHVFSRLGDALVAQGAIGRAPARIELAPVEVSKCEDDALRPSGNTPVDLITHSLPFRVQSPSPYPPSESNTHDLICLVSGSHPMR